MSADNFNNMIRYIIYIVMTMSIMTFFSSCNIMTREPIATITRLRNIDNIKLFTTLGEQPREKVLYDKDVISRLISYFDCPFMRIYRRHDNRPTEEFSKIGELVISFTDNRPAFVIELGMYDYRVEINSRLYHEFYTKSAWLYIFDLLFCQCCQ